MGGHSFHGTADATSIWQPAIASRMYQFGGIPLGKHQRTNQIVWLWPSSLVPLSHLISVEGLRGFGKSACMKSCALRLKVIHARDVYRNKESFRIRLNSRKSEGGIAEYDPLLNFLQTHSYDLGRGHSLNLFGFFSREADVAVVSLSLAKHLAGAQLSGQVRVSILVGVHKMFKLVGKRPHPAVLERLLRNPKLSDFDDFYRAGDEFLENLLKDEIAANPEIRKELRLDRPSLKETDVKTLEKSNFEASHLQASRQAADLFLDLIKGYGGIFAGEEDLYDILTQPDVGLDWENMAEGAAEILEPILMKAEASAITYAREGYSDARDLSRIIPHANFTDEEGKAMEREMHVEFKAAKINSLRAFPCVEFEAKQYAIQGSQVGEEGSSHRKHAQEVEFGIGARILFRQPDDDTFLHNHFSVAGMSDENVDKLRKQEVGQAMLWLPGRKPVPFNLQLLPSEVPLVQTVGASEQMNDHIPLIKQAGWLERSRKMGSLVVGLDQTDHG